MSRALASLAVAVAVGVVLIRPAVAGEKPEQIIYQGKPITLGAAVEATEWFSVREVKFRVGKFTVDGKPALVASGFLDSHWDMPTRATIRISAYAWREDVRPRRLVPFALVAGSVDVTEPGKPTKFYAAGEIPPPDPGLKKPRSPAVLYYTAGASGDTWGKVGVGSSTFPGEKADEIIHDNRPIALGAWVEAKEWFTARDLTFRMGQLLDGKPAMVAWGQVEAQSPVGQRVGIGVQVFVPREGDPDRPIMLYGRMSSSVEGVGAGKPAKFQAVSIRLEGAREVPQPKKVFYCVGCSRQ